MEMGMSLDIHIKQKQELKLKQRLQLHQRAFGLRMELVQALRGVRYTPKGDCPQCNKKMTPVEIIRGFNQDPNDFTTRCARRRCGYRFTPILAYSMGAIQAEIPFYCAAQTLARLPGKETLSPERFAREYSAIYHSAVIHHGGIGQAFRKIGTTYAFKELDGAKRKIKPFLGKLPDTVIAECADIPVSAVRAMRKQLNIPRHLA
ncbi:hypothetical protein A3C91_00015 [Candidatus Azambacteria bacterium RIFCSPHIGHO2_02_FULL_52_12]|uniref:Uncharacterized protein n=1 Tax=Candidatus Azambacteria bacterium RIFCSPLOWO2_01_FULL_46_25 TaxID=1797298 RepID=A0A1F5BUP3_9BACT|nr:MAG: hypothetical protein A3C91_00015 [Candidatus Azambacteria bacterium RIFCSPHIGHO2_02_FULL_52_12]OGD34345.1 MAG: hypothetical protein A2988_02345 [Candidatus Azambacteria bacterium RIFCSPLOWO2_01_FULL_46_25]OGD37377.1 MAG: hypothetical protein A2850_01540 [Candidatus Azambacteria bacterium RIFCSPHIGHO2_01_FULL_51_74]